MKNLDKLLFILLISCSSGPKKSELKYSNTMTWNKDYWNMTTHPFKVIDTKDEPKLPPPPANDSEETTQELAYLLTLQEKRTPEQIAEIKSQLDILDIRFDCFQFRQLEDKKLKALPKLIDLVKLDMFGMVMRQKRIYDRVRPSYLEPRLKTVVEIPEHPAYPSGHASEMFFYAHLFSYFNPAKKDIYFSDARRIATNREIAGVHYPSDTRAGIMLAEQVFNGLMKKEQFRLVMDDAAKEFRQKITCK